MKRKPLSKRVRFETFKRDYFQCQYCGASPPKVLLHVDHICPVALGGTNDPENLVTSCQDCNLGKGAVSLESRPQSLADKAQEAAEREAQLLGYQEILDSRRERIERECWNVVRRLFGEDRERIPRDQYASIDRFVQKLGVHVCYEAVDIALTRSVGTDMSDGRLFRYFCGICWNKIRALEGGR